VSTDQIADVVDGGAAGENDILIVDDATVVRMYYRQILESAGYQVGEAINGLEGLEKAAQHRYALCIVDVNMPVMDGYAFLHALRREPSLRAMPALMTSTEAGAEDRHAARQSGANFYLIKPVAKVQLAMHVAAMLGRASA
jgi:two-component system chemotaxis response regulator CheY